MLAKVLLRNEKRIQTAMFVKVDTILHRKPTSPTFNIRNQSVFGNNFAPCELYEVILCRMYKVLYAEMRNELFLWKKNPLGNVINKFSFFHKQQVGLIRG